MSSSERGEDISFLLYLVPIFAAIVYGIYEWVVVGRASNMPFLAYIIVAKSPYLFLLSLIAVCAAIVVEIRSTKPAERERIVRANTTRLLWLALIVLLISFAAAVNVADYNLGNGASVFVDGRYPLIYSFFLVGISLLLTPKQMLGGAKLTSLPEIFGMVLLVASPLVYYLALKANISFNPSAIAGIITAVVGLVLLLAGPMLIGKKQPAKIETAQKTV